MRKALLIGLGIIGLTGISSLPALADDCASSSDYDACVAGRKIDHAGHTAHDEAAQDTQHVKNWGNRTGKTLDNWSHDTGRKMDRWSHKTGSDMNRFFTGK
ncbi:hypothetical protein CFR73_03190 [Novacetimonas maltaceti]|uniref:Lipoprotein n=1 Tax=Novacetimonas maltaceti TaxID=1203393 RepID=A0A2S3W5P4_9PROT|nr:hypothetical protein [Novacetimonas maltaceti]POF64194.1 hypothetical protein KMAL_00880 [Novacetimonas maltaceti]PYD61532.1 hypothetical protein CFR73_03190 [Novacetimonas maltaceti]